MARAYPYEVIYNGGSAGERSTRAAAEQLVTRLVSMSRGKLTSAAFQIREKKVMNDDCSKLDAILGKIDAWDPPRRSGLWGGKNESKLQKEVSANVTAHREKTNERYKEMEGPEWQRKQQEVLSAIERNNKARAKKDASDLGARMAKAVREKEKRTGEPHKYEGSRRSGPATPQQTELEGMMGHAKKNYPEAFKK
jgi:hypothetical protein